MTDAYVEHLCEHCLLVRVGAIGPFPAPYRYSVTFVQRDGWSEGVGFDHKGATPEEFEAVIRLVNQVTGKLVAYWRAGPPPIRVVQIDPGLINGKILMSKDKHQHRHAHEAKKDDGSLDQNTVLIHSLEAIIAVLKGELKIVGGDSKIDAGSPKLMHYSFSAEIQ